jgi:hypothetical protein
VLQWYNSFLFASMHCTYKLSEIKYIVLYFYPLIHVLVKFGSFSKERTKNRVLSTINETETEEMREGRRKLHEEKTNTALSSSILLGIISSKRKRWADHVACVTRKMHTRL